ncbi:PAS domain S-box [Desulfocurvibacter africanus PCS]|uniref:PAS domain S-box n=1 Tax=Desulfocurvibacter africanus PCS TaxID=1262666 RepID=M5PR02_DESAF|nr:SpoIIE family protein phosphatase [Desulfocurvibacter africanus]EMG36534.1 PAS domain S-box [Desulfocurvibacter africanus PCS]
MNGFLRNLLIGTVYFGLGQLGLALAAASTNIAPIWPASGFAFAAILLWNLSCLPYIVLADLALSVTTGPFAASDVLTALANALSALAGMVLLQRFKSPGSIHERSWNMVLLLLCGTVVTAGLASSMSVLGLVRGGQLAQAEALPVWWTWFLSDAAGVVLLTPLLVVWQEKGLAGLRPWRPESLLLLTGLLLAGWVMFGQRQLEIAEHYPVAFVLAPVLVWAGFRLDLRILTLAILVFSVQAVAGTTMSLGPFGHLGLPDSYLLLQVFLMVMASMVFILSSVNAQSHLAELSLRQSQAALRYANERLEQRVLERTKELRQALKELRRAERSYRALYENAIQGMFRSSLDGRIKTANPAFAHMLGYASPEDLLRESGMESVYVFPEDRREWLASIRQQGFLRNYELRLRRKDGTPLWVLGNVLLTQGDDGEEVLEGIEIDVTEKALAEQELERERQRLEEDLRAAGEIQKRLLPRDGAELPGAAMAWTFVPSGQVGGDAFNFLPLADGSTAFYMLDVSGHGVPSALVAFSACQALQDAGGMQGGSTAGRLGIMPRPVEVMRRLEAEFPFNRFGQFFTLCYMVLDARQGLLTWSCAGHPPPLLLRPGQTPSLLDGSGPAVGLGHAEGFREDQVALEPGDRLLLYTDGVTEYRAADGELFGEERLLAVLAEAADLTREQVLAHVTERLGDFGQGRRPGDDVSMLLVEYLGPEGVGGKAGT